MMPMIELSSVWEFSRQNCVAICAFLVPANVLVTLYTLFLFFWKRPFRQIQLSVGIAGIFAIAMMVHVATWFAIGVVTPITFILISLAGLCLSVNGIALVGFYPYHRHYASQWATNFRHTVYQYLHN
ncbi:MAG: hypothetical protein SAJ12_24590 [Jaaginema sp. PMC 1079.18]|nr:hypothetical protein [Jaaginema sp. PMC 1080.18]MEC4854173.1 hypothetical protein [Jaaginema sp. PMC 1079.18]MEC4867763.1 hypothetical protein [Jaaginema sp. PMC 1078.18]